VRVFLDSSALLSASGSPTGASRAVIELAPARRWTLLSSEYCLSETIRNLPKVGAHAGEDFARHVAPFVRFTKDRVSSANPLVMEKTKDRPVVITALAERAHVLLTWDRADFHRKLGSQVYGMLIRTPGEWLEEVLSS
jgi:predicted nucleic acid-binding protein